MCKQKPIEIYATTEGLYLMKKQINYTGYVLKNSNTQLTTNKFLLDADTDYNKIKQLKVYQEMNLRIWKELKGRIMKEIKDESGNEL